ncbi:hypothetical protein [Salinigranum marinum]|uniref:hypothetical protein n=1 Tax=Salinigranum marinum TaxID=1515595 RepID=UPI002989F33F|nr:hypothetical protein [Salinigranum marinum]
MQRRQVLAALGVLLPAGCLGAKQSDSSGGVRTEGGSSGTARPTDTPTPTPEPTPEPTETPEPGPSDEKIEAGDEAISQVQSEFAAAVEAYTGDDDDALTEVSVTGTDFDVRSVLLALDTVQRELVTAESAAVTDEQRETVADLQVAEQFLTQSALVHSYFVESADRLDATHSALSADVDDIDDVEDELEDADSRFESTLDRGSEGVSTIKNDIEPDPVAAAEPFDDETYDDTVSMFESVRSAFDDAASGLNRMIQGLDELSEAQDDQDDGDDSDAEDKADEARELFDEAYDFFDDAADTAGDLDADDLEDLLEDLRAVADDRYTEADDLYDDVS